MKTYLDCIPCFVSQALQAARLVCAEEEVHEAILREVLAAVARVDMRDTPPEMGQLIHRVIRRVTGSRDPYLAVKEASNRMMLERLEALRRLVGRQGDPFEAAVRLAIAGNIIDYGADAGLEEGRIHEVIDECLHAPLLGAPVERLREAVGGASRILYLADNAGEIVLDRLLLEQMPCHRVTVAVRGGAVINDATLSDARAAGLENLAELVDNGSDAPGTVLHDCSEEFRRLYAEADLVVAKGQGNYETLSGGPGRVFFLLKVKCAVVARHTGVARGSLLLLESGG